MDLDELEDRLRALWEKVNAAEELNDRLLFERVMLERKVADLEARLEAADRPVLTDEETYALLNDTHSLGLLLHSRVEGDIYPAFCEVHRSAKAKLRAYCPRLSVRDFPATEGSDE